MRNILVACVLAAGCGQETSGVDQGAAADQSAAHDLGGAHDLAQSGDAAAPGDDAAAADDAATVDDMPAPADMPKMPGDMGKVIPDLAGADLPVVKPMPDLSLADFAGVDLPIKPTPDLMLPDMAIGKGMCNSNADCAKVDYCAFPNQPSCNPPGTCQPRPQACIQIFDPVCGCDGKDYSNSCFAAAAGQNYAHKGKCP